MNERQNNRLLILVLAFVGVAAVMALASCAVLAAITYGHEQKIRCLDRAVYVRSIEQGCDIEAVPAPTAASARFPGDPEREFAVGLEDLVGQWQYDVDHRLMVFELRRQADILEIGERANRP